MYFVDRLDQVEFVCVFDSFMEVLVREGSVFGFFLVDDLSLSLGRSLNITTIWSQLLSPSCVLALPLSVHRRCVNVNFGSADLQRINVQTSEFDFEELRIIMKLLSMISTAFLAFLAFAATIANDGSFVSCAGVASSSKITDGSYKLPVAR